MIGRRTLFLSRLALCVIVASATLGAQNRAPDRSSSHAIAPAQAHEYAISAHAGDLLRVDVVQDDIDVVVSLADSHGRELLSVDASADEVFPETLVAIVEEDGAYTVTVRPVASARARGRYSIQLAPTRAATAADRRVVEAERAFADGMRLLTRARAAGWTEALSRFRAAVTAYRDAGDRRGEMKALFGVSRAQYRLHDPGGLQSARETEQLSRTLGEPRATANVLVLIGDILIYQGDVTAAREPFDESLAIARQLGSRTAEMRTLNDAALAYDRLGDAERSITMLERSLVLARDAHDTGMEANLLNNLGVTYRQLGDFDRSLDRYEQALANRRAAGDIGGEMLALNNIGNLKGASGHAKEALPFHVQALALARQIGSPEQEARALSSLGNTERLLGDTAQALEHERAALALRQTIGDVSGQADALEHIGQAEQRLGHIDEAAAALEEALAIRRRSDERYTQIDSLVDLAQLERERGRYDQAVGYAAAATDLDEQLRRQITTPDLRVAFRARGQDSYEVLIDLLQRHGGVDSAAASLDVSERARARVLLESVVESRIDRSQYVALPPANPLTAQEIQQRVVDDHTVLLEFALGDERSWLWAITPTSITTQPLPPRREIEAAARKVAASLSAPSGRVPADAAFSRMLFGDLGSRFETEWRGKRLAIVPSGALGYVPFAALPVPGTRAVPLAARHELVVLPSASVIAALRDQAARRAPAHGTVAIVADPVFGPADPRVQATSARVAPAEAPASAPLPRLAFSRAEANAIAALVPRASVLEVTGFQASRATLLHGALDDYRIVHIATHGVVDSARPARSALILSLVDQSGARQDGYVWQRDIYTMKLNADLVVLSACQTALGKEVRGEGLMGLSRAFMYAGTPRVVASLWEVGDRATAVFMTRFYDHLLRQHLTAAASLRAAQLQMARDPRWAAPYYWAGFVLHGDWR